MKWTSTYPHPQDWTFEIEERVMHESASQQDFQAFFLRVFDKDGEQLFDYFQEEMAAAKNQALRKLGVPVDSWVEQGDVA